ncbi:MAG: hypothetical protein M4579_007317 [Chaenotheca gracillima]|nr:MAG: hypothetical protein M4579_007317 [Chaenotheca gracillima]
MSALMAASVLAGPIDKRVYVTDVDVVTQVITVTAGQPVPTPTTSTSVQAPVAPSKKVEVQYKAPAPHKKHHHKKPAPKPVTTTAAPPPPPPATTPTPTPSTTAAAAPKSSAAPASSGSSSGSTGSAPSPQDYSASALYNHNIHRANHSASDLTWDDQLASIAKTIAGSCNYAHNVKEGGISYGQNIAAGAKPEDVEAVITNQFYNNEIGFYPGYGSEPSMADFDKWGHFSQVIWAGSKKVGCYTMDCSSQGLTGEGITSEVPPYFTVCNYSPPGNYGGEYAKNVKAPSGAKMYVPASNL